MLWPALFDRDDAVVRTATPELCLVGVVDHRGQAAPHQQHRHLDALEHVPQSAEVHRAHMQPARSGRAAQLVAPRPRPVVPLHRVVEDPAPQRGERAGGVELHRALEDLVEGGERLRPGQEGGDVRALLPGDARGDVDQGQPAHRLGMGAGQGDGGGAAERHPDDQACIGRQPGDDQGDVLGHGGGVEHLGVAGPVGVAVPGQVDGHEGPVEGQRHRVPGVGVLAAAVKEHCFGRSRPPYQRAHRSARFDLDELPPHRGRAVPGQPDLAGVLLEHGELVVGDVVGGAHFVPSFWRPPRASTSSPSVPGESA